MRADLAPYGAPCLCETVGARTDILDELGDDPRLVGLVSPSYVVTALWSQMAPDARAAFDMIDTDGSGALDTDEVSGALPAAELQPLVTLRNSQLSDISVMLGGEPMTEEQIHEAMRVLDTDRNGTIEFDEFQAWWDSDSNEVKIGGLTAAGTVAQVIEHVQGWERRFGPRMITTVEPETPLEDVVGESALSPAPASGLLLADRRVW